MNTLALLAGKVSHLNTVASTSGHGGSDYVHISTRHTALFGVDGRPARFGGVANLAEGDAVTLVGYEAPEFEAIALRNDSAGGVVYRAPQGIWGLVGCMFAGGAAVLFLLGAVIPLALGAFGILPGAFYGIGFFELLVGVVLLGGAVWYYLRALSRKRFLDRQIPYLLTNGGC